MVSADVVEQDAQDNNQDVDRVIEVELQRTRCFGLLRQNCPADGPFSKAAGCLVDNNAARAAWAVLGGYYRSKVPGTAADVLGLQTTHELADYPPLAAVLPWMGMSPGAYLVAMETGIRGYCLQNNMADWGVTDGHTQFGPVSRRKLRYEIERLRGLVDSVREIGVSDQCGPPVLGCLIIDDREGLSLDENWRFDVRDGLHRCAAFAAVGLARVEMRVVTDLGPATRRSQSASWPGVQSGLFTEADALSIFDQYFAGTL